MADFPEKREDLTVLHIITSLNTGGAEMMVLKLLETLQPSINSCVVVLMGPGALSSRLEALGVPVRYLGLRQGAIPGIRTVKQLISLAREFRPAIIQGWMYHGNLAAWLVAVALQPKPALVWNIRQTLYQLGKEKNITSWVIKAGAWLSRRPSRIVYNSALSALQHEAVGYSSATRAIIPNGFNLNAFKPDAKQRELARRELLIEPGTRLIGHVARYHPMKDHANLLQAARDVVNCQQDVRFVLVGREVTLNNRMIAEQIKSLGLEQHVILLGERHDLPAIVNAFDLVVSSSAWGEGFPNVVGEAMASGVPCVVTDVGDSGYVVGDFGRVVPPNDSAALAGAIVEMLELNPDSYARIAFGARDRVAELFALDRVGLSYLNLYRDVGEV